MYVHLFYQAVKAAMVWIESESSDALATGLFFREGVVYAS